MILFASGIFKMCDKPASTGDANKQKIKYVSEYDYMLKMWDFKKNVGVSPETTNAGSHKKLWWICENGHSYQTEVRVIRNGHKCPYCTIGGRRHCLKGFNDIATTHPGLAKEWDYKRNHGHTPDEFTDGSDFLAGWVCENGHHWHQRIYVRAKNGNNCPYCSDRQVLAGYNSLADMYPDLVEELHPTKNGDLDPKKIHGNSQKSVWWKGKCGHEWSVSLRARTRDGHGCPICAGKTLLSGDNDLVHLHPEVVPYYSPANEKDVNKMIGIFNTSIIWRCPKCGGDYRMGLKDFAAEKEHVCLYCEHLRPLKGFNTIDVLYPELLEEWDYAKNYLIANPENLTTRSYRPSVYWKCKNNPEHFYTMSVAERIIFSFSLISSSALERTIERI